MINTANIVVTFDLRSMIEFVKRRGTSPFSRIEEDLEGEKKLFLFSNEGNSGFISLEHDFNYLNEGPLLKLSFIDPNKVFEQRLIESTATDDIKLSTTSGTIINSEISPFLSKEVLAFLAQLESAELNKSIYVTYGVGSNIDSWAGPFKLFFKGAVEETDSTTGRIITLHLVPSDDPISITAGVAGQNISLDLKGFGLRCEGLYRVPEGAIANLDYHKLVTEPVKDFLRKVTKRKQIIVLFSDLNKTHSKAITSLEKSTTEKKPVRGYNPFLSNSIVSREEYKKRILARVKSFNSIFGMGAKLERDRTYTLPSESPVVYETRAKDYEIFSLLRMNLDTFEDSTQTDFDDFYEHNFGYGYTLRKVENGINRGSAANQCRVRMFQENNLDILSIWKKAGWIEDDSDPVIVYGDEDLVRPLLYGVYKQDLLRLAATSPEKFSELDVFDNFVIHPDDDLYKNRKIHKDLRKIILKPITDLYGDPQKLQDVLSIYNEDLEEIEGSVGELRESLNIPIFRSNVPNPNVTDLRITKEDSYFRALSTGILRGFRSASLRAFFGEGKDLSKALNFNSGELNYVLNQVKQWRKGGDSLDLIGSRLIDRFSAKLRPADTQLLVDFIIAVTLQKETKDGPYIEIDEAFDASPAIIQQEILDDAKRLAFKVEVKTLPLFYYSTTIHQGGMPAILLSHNPQFMGIDNKLDFIDSVNTGFYLITGFRHVIDGSDVFSEFALISTLRDTVKEISLKTNTPEETVRKLENPVELNRLLEALQR